MQSSKIPQWLVWAREIEAIAQTGMHFSNDQTLPYPGRVFDQKRYSRLMDIASEIVASFSTMEKTKISRMLESEKGYATPKIDVRAAILEDRRILLVQEKLDKRWSMPGGWADVGEIPSRMIEREVLEESGLVVRAKKLVGIFDANHDRQPQDVFHAYKIVYLCVRIGGKLQGSDETIDARFFPIEELPPFSDSRTDLRHIQEAYQHHLHPGRHTYFE